MHQPKALEALFPGARRLILSAMFGEPQRWWSLPDLAGRAGMQPGSLRTHLLHLKDGGVIREKTERGRVRFQPDQACCVYVEIQAIVTKLLMNGRDCETILIVEDQPATAKITHILLESWGYRVLEAHCAEEALKMFERHAEEIQLLLTDMALPGMDGARLADELQRRRPMLRVVVMAGYSDDQLIGHDAAFLSKPFNPIRLSRTVRKELDRPEGARRRTA